MIAEVFLAAPATAKVETSQTKTPQTLVLINSVIQRGNDMGLRIGL